MKIAITSTGTSLDSNVDPRFGRCAYFIIYDIDSDTFEFIENTSRQAMGGAGIQAGQLMASKNVGAVITGNLAKCFQSFRSRKNKMYSGVSGTVREAIEKYKNGQLTEISAPDVSSVMEWVEILKNIYLKHQKGDM